jgi:carboxylesterase type B
MNKFCLIIIAASFFLARLVEAQPHYKSLLNIVYSTVDGEQLTLNAFLPADAADPVPAIVEIHGGWFSL